MFKHQFKNTIYLLFLLLMILPALLFIKAGNLSKFSSLPGDRVFYLNASSSQALQKERLTIPDLFLVKGERIALQIEYLEGDRYEVSEKIARCVAEKFGAKILLKESASDVISYYAYAPSIKDYIRVGGYAVNLHVAVGNGRVVIGTPIIFGGY